MKRYILRHKLLFLITVILSVFSGLISLYLAYIMEVVSDIVFNLNTTRIMECVLLIVVFFIYSCVISYLFTNIKSHYREVLKADVSADLYSSIMTQKYNEFSKNSQGTYLSYFTNDIKMIDEYYFVPMLTFISDLFLIMCIFFYVGSVDFRILFAMFLVSLFTLSIPKLMEKKLEEYSNQLSQFSQEYNSKLKEYFQGFDVIHDYDVLPSFLKKGKILIRSFEKKQAKVNAMVNLNQNLASIFASVGQLFYMLFIGYLIIIGEVNPMFLLPVTNISGNFIASISGIASDLGGFKSVRGIGENLINIINSQSIESQSAIEPLSVIDFDNVTFGYDPLKPVLINFSFKFEKGKKYAVVGDSGSGKSTLIKILRGYYPVQSGKVTLLPSNCCTTIHQESHIFNDSLRENLSLGKNIDDKSLKKALKLSALSDIDLDQIISENGDNISGGQLQRISIARAYTHLNSILLCDEITSSLDNKTTQYVENNLLNLKNITLIYITHKLKEDQLKKFDDILVLEKGKLIEHGSFYDLMNRKQAFVKLFKK